MNTDYRAVIVTGGAYGIGRGICRHFASRGDAVTIADIDPRRGEELRAELQGKGQRALYVATDVRSDAAIREMIERTVAEWGRLDVLVNNAGVEVQRRPEESTLEDWNFMNEVNFRAAFLAAKYAFPHLKEKRGSIINIASIQGLANQPVVSIYAATKAGMLGLTRGMAVDFASNGIRVNAVCPGAIYTAMMEQVLANTEEPEAALRQIDERVPLGRIGQPEDVAGAVYFLASPEAAYITGAHLVVDGGLLAKLAI